MALGRRGDDRVTHNASTEDPESSESLEARSQALKGTIGIATGVFLGPLSVLGFFLVLNWLEPRALGTYSFLIGGPLVLALLAARAPHKGILKSFALTLAGVTSLAVVMYVARLEIGLCLVVLLAPFLMVGSLISLLFDLSELRKVQKWLRTLKATALLLLIVPPGLAFIESHYFEMASSRQIVSSIAVSAKPSTIWDGIIEVAPFAEEELPATWLQPLGVPRPVRATIDAIDGARVRIGYFENGLRFREHVTTFLANQELGLSVTVESSSLNVNDVARHAFAQGFFEIDDVRYEISPQGRTTVLSLSCRYTVHTTVTPYAHAVAGVIMKAFQRNLLMALASRFEHGLPSGGTLLVVERR
jgi:hypothetical protein